MLHTSASESRLMLCEPGCLMSSSQHDLIITAIIQHWDCWSGAKTALRLGLPSSTTSLLSKGIGVRPLLAKPGTKNLVTVSMKPTSATTVGLWRRTCICTCAKRKYTMMSHDSAHDITLGQDTPAVYVYGITATIDWQRFLSPSKSVLDA